MDGAAAYGMSGCDCAGVLLQIPDLTGLVIYTSHPQFPGLINGCTIDWYLPWPEEALTAVSSKFLDSFAIECAPEVSR